MYTLEEYIKMQGEKKKHQFEVRKPNEGVENEKWNNMKKLEKVKIESEDEEEEEVEVQVCDSNVYFIKSIKFLSL